MTSPEDAILSAALCHPDTCLPTLTEAGVRPETFALAANRRLFSQIVTNWLEKRPVNAIGIATSLAGDLGDCGGFPRLSDLEILGTVPASLPHYIESVKDAWARRQIERCLRENLAVVGTTPPAEIMAAIEASMGAIASTRDTKRIPTTAAIVRNVVQAIQSRTDGNAISGWRTGIAALDAETGGIRRGGYWVIAGPTKGGKSALVRFIVNTLAIAQKVPVLLFGLEMSSEDTVEAMMAEDGPVSASRMRDGQLTEGDLQLLGQTATRITQAPLHFRDDVYDIAGIRAYTRQMKAIRPDLGCVVVDYVQLADGIRSPGANREQEIAGVSKALRRMAKDENLAVIALSQLNDDGELRECRALGMDATVQVTIELTKEPGARKLRLRQRQGKTGIAVNVAFLGDTFQWHPLADEPEPQETINKRNNSRRWND